VTFVSSMLERVIEEQRRGDQTRPMKFAVRYGAEIGAEIKNHQRVRRSEAGQGIADQTKISGRNIWSRHRAGCGGVQQSQPMSQSASDEIGVRGDSFLEHPEPEVRARDQPRGPGRRRGARQRRDLRDFEDAAALLLARQKTTTSCAIALSSPVRHHYGNRRSAAHALHIVIAGPEG